MKIIRACLLIFSITLVFLASNPAGAASFAFDLPTAGGGWLDIEQFRGRVVVVDFFATYCRPCKSAWPKLNRIKRHFEHRGVSVIGYSLDRRRDRRKVLPYVVKHRMNFPVVLGNKRQAARLAGVKKLPTTVVLDRRGRMVARFEGLVSESTLLAAIYPHMSRHAPPAPEASRVFRRRPEDRRIRRVWITPAPASQREAAFHVHVEAEVVDLATEQGLWLGLYLRPEVRSAGGLTALGTAKPLYMRIKKAGQKHFVLLVQYRQLPRAPRHGLHRLWVALLGPGLKPLEKSGEMVFDFHMDQIPGLK